MNVLKSIVFLTIPIDKAIKLRCDIKFPLLSVSCGYLQLCTRDRKKRAFITLRFILTIICNSFLQCYCYCS